jgi:hypothetical protein
MTMTHNYSGEKPEVLLAVCDVITTRSKLQLITNYQGRWFQQKSAIIHKLLTFNTLKGEDGK